MMDFDVIIIGAGIAGITLAKHFPSDLKVALVDKGDYGYNQKLILMIMDPQKI